MFDRRILQRDEKSRHWVDLAGFFGGSLRLSSEASFGCGDSRSSPSGVVRHRLEVRFAWRG